jgi:hypothetical protein
MARKRRKKKSRKGRKENVELSRKNKITRQNKVRKTQKRKMAVRKRYPIRTRQRKPKNPPRKRRHTVGKRVVRSRKRKAPTRRRSRNEFQRRKRTRPVQRQAARKTRKVQRKKSRPPKVAYLLTFDYTPVDGKPSITADLIVPDKPRASKEHVIAEAERLSFKDFSKSWLVWLLANADDSDITVSKSFKWAFGKYRIIVRSAYRENGKTIYEEGADENSDESEDSE